MTVPLRYTLAHGPVIAALGRVAMSGLRKDKPAHPPPIPSPWIEARLPPRPRHHPRLHPACRRRPRLVPQPHPRALLPASGASRSASARSRGSAIRWPAG